MSISLLRRGLTMAAVLILLALTAITPVLAHEERTVAGYDMEVGMIGEPVFTGQKSGLEFSVFKDDVPVIGLQDTLQAEAIFGEAHRNLPISRRFGEDGWYQSYFFPTVAGPYTFRIFGTIEGNAIDETFTAGPDGFGEVQEASSGQFPTTLPALSDISAQAQKGADAAGQVTLALGLGGLGFLLGLVGIGLAVAARRRPA
ncbi:MAG TPA: hypothetical protein VIF08_02515 [Candidatus Limnocylindrales bacterium]